MATNKIQFQKGLMRRDEYLRIALNLTTPIWEESVGEGKSEGVRRTRYRFSPRYKQI